MQFLTLEQTQAPLTPAPSLLAMTPEEYQQQGQGLEIIYGVHESRFGPLLMGQGDRGLCTLQFLDSTDSDVQATAKALLKKQWPQASFRADDQGAAMVQNLFKPQAPRDPLTLWVKGTDFQIQVWRALLKIPLGQRATYRELACAIGKPTAARAVGNAIGKNPIAYLIPCHRVIRESGALGGYRWGGDRKAALLDWESAYGESSKNATPQLSEEAEVREAPTTLSGEDVLPDLRWS